MLCSAVVSPNIALRFAVVSPNILLRSAKMYPNILTFWDIVSEHNVTSCNRVSYITLHSAEVSPNRML
jgi:hypothetical protein